MEYRSSLVRRLASLVIPATLHTFTTLVNCVMMCSWVSPLAFDGRKLILKFLTLSHHILIQLVDLLRMEHLNSTSCNQMIRWPARNIRWKSYYLPIKKTDLIQQLVSVPSLSSQHHTLVGQNSCFSNCVNTSLNECAVIEISSHLDKFLRGRLLPWHTPPWQKFVRANAFQNKESNVLSACSVVHNNLNIIKTW